MLSSQCFNIVRASTHRHKGATPWGQNFRRGKQNASYPMEDQASPKKARNLTPQAAANDTQSDKWPTNMQLDPPSNARDEGVIPISHKIQEFLFNVGFYITSNISYMSYFPTAKKKLFSDKSYFPTCTRDLDPS